MKTPLVTLTALCLLALPGCVIAADCRYSDGREQVVDVGGAERVVIDAAAGWLRVEGGASSQVAAHGRACASSEKILDDIELTVDRRGDTIRVRVDMPHSFSWGRRRYARLDLEVELPDSLPVEIEDGSGWLEVRGVTSVRIKDGSGAIDIAHVGSVRIGSDGSGSIYIRYVAGDFTLDKDGSGSVQIADVKGRVEVP